MKFTVVKRCLCQLALATLIFHAWTDGQADPRTVSWTPATRDTTGQPLSGPSYTRIRTSDCAQRTYAVYQYQNVTAQQSAVIDLPELAPCECVDARTYAPNETPEYSAWTPQVRACFLDSDSDGVVDNSDNCPLEANPSQCDSDGDGFGNRCDGDLGPGTGNGYTNAQDVTLFRGQLGKASVAPTYKAADINCNGAVNAQDYTIFRSLVGSPPGP